MPAVCRAELRSEGSQNPAVGLGLGAPAVKGGDRQSRVRRGAGLGPGAGTVGPQRHQQTASTQEACSARAGSDHRQTHVPRCVPTPRTRHCGWGPLLRIRPSGTRVLVDIFLSSSSLVAQRVRSLPAVRETRLRPLGGADPLEKEMATHSSILAWRIPWTEEPGGLQSRGPQRVGHD